MMKTLAFALLATLASVPKERPTPLPLPPLVLQYEWALAETADNVHLALSTVEAELVVLPGERHPDVTWFSTKQMPKVLYYAFGSTTLKQFGGVRKLEQMSSFTHTSTDPAEIKEWTKRGFEPHVKLRFKLQVMNGQD